MGRSVLRRVEDHTAQRELSAKHLPTSVDGLDRLDNGSPRVRIARAGGAEASISRLTCTFKVESLIVQDYGK